MVAYQSKEVAQCHLQVSKQTAAQQHLPTSVPSDFKWYYPIYNAVTVLMNALSAIQEIFKKIYV